MRSGSFNVASYIGACFAFSTLLVLLNPFQFSDYVNEQAGRFVRTISMPVSPSEDRGARVIIVDDASLAEWGYTWPPDRSLYAALLDRLAGAGAAQVAFDLIMLDGRDAASDQMLVEALERAAPTQVVLACARTVDGRCEIGRALREAADRLAHVHLADISQPGAVLSGAYQMNAAGPMDMAQTLAGKSGASARKLVAAIPWMMPNVSECGLYLVEQQRKRCEALERNWFPRFLNEVGGELDLVRKGAGEAGVAPLPAATLATWLASEDAVAWVEGQTVFVGADFAFVPDHLQLEPFGAFPAVYTHALMFTALKDGTTLYNADWPIPAAPKIYRLGQILSTFLLTMLFAVIWLSLRRQDTLETAPCWLLVWPAAVLVCTVDSWLFSTSPDIAFGVVPVVGAGFVLPRQWFGKGGETP